MDVVRTTVRLDVGLMRDAKRFAAETGRTLTSLIEDALREVLTRRTAEPPAKPARLPTYRGKPGGLQPGVDLDDTAALFDLMDDEGPDASR